MHRARGESPSPARLRCASPGDSPRKERGEVGKNLHRQSRLLRQFLQRHLRPRADVLDHFGCGERP